MRLRTLMIAVAVLTPLVYLVVIPAWRYYSLSPADRAIVDALGQRHDMPFAEGETLEEILKYIKTRSVVAHRPHGIPIYVDPFGLDETGKTMQTPVQISSKGATLNTSLKQILTPLGLAYQVKDGLLTITSEKAIKLQQTAEAKQDGR
jgi:hypothetical protein